MSPSDINQRKAELIAIKQTINSYYSFSTTELERLRVKYIQDKVKLATILGRPRVIRRILDRI